ncbi:MAG: copper chaperone PCu(A)C [Burkholderiaceae bacterium]
MTRIFVGLATALAVVASLSVHAHGGHGSQGHESHDHSHHGHGHGHHHGHELPVFPDAARAEAPDGVTVEGCWIRALPNRLPAAAYLKVANAGAQDVVMVGAQADGFGRVMLHAHQTVNGMASMVHAGKVVVPAGGSFDFAPGGHHVMLEKPQIDLKIGGTHPITLWFDGNLALTASCDVSPPSRMK